VLAGTPNGTAQVGRAWAFKPETANLARLKIVSGPAGVDITDDQFTWTPTAKAGRAEPQPLVVEGCAADGRCVTQTWYINAYSRGLAPAGPPRGFKVLDSVVKRRQTIELRAQGVDEQVTVEVDGRPVKARIRDEQTVAAVLPRTLAKGAHDISLRIGEDLEETLDGALVVR
jgi:hypothetical protein